MTDVKVFHHNSTHVYIEADYTIKRELAKTYSFRVQNYKFNPLYKAGIWDGWIKLFNSYTGMLSAGLAPALYDYCQQEGYSTSFSGFPKRNEFTKDAYEKFVKILNLPFEPRYYQADGVQHAIEDDRCLLISPTNSGKSLIMYMICQWYRMRKLIEGKKILIIVPSIQLVSQLYKNFEEYGYDAEKNIHCITAGVDKDPGKKSIVISTYQSIYKLDEDYFKQFGLVITDEVHKATAKSLTGIMERLVDCRYKIGCTGTLQDTLSDKMALKGLFGETHQLITNAEMIKRGWSTDIRIKGMVLKYSEDERKVMKKVKYQEEVDYIINHRKRARFVHNLALHLKGNTLILYRYVDKQGKPTFKRLEAVRENVHFVSGKVKVDDREIIRGILNQKSDAIVVASLATFGTGIDAKNIDNIILIAPTKSKIAVLQMIGRGLRTAEGKDFVTLYDTVDDLSWKSRKNYSLQHFFDRMEYYKTEKFKFKTYNIDL